MSSNESQPPILQLEPPEVVEFRDKLGHVAGTPLTVKNKSNAPVFFKVKSTASKFYHVRPSSGIINPHSQVKVVIQPQEDSPSALDIIERENHRFMVQTAYVGKNGRMDPDEFWKNVNATTVQLTSAKLRAKVHRIQFVQAGAAMANDENTKPSGNTNASNGNNNGVEHPPPPSPKVVPPPAPVVEQHQSPAKPVVSGGFGYARLHRNANLQPLGERKTQPPVQPQAQGGVQQQKQQPPRCSPMRQQYQRPQPVAAAKESGWNEKDNNSGWGDPKCKWTSPDASVSASGGNGLEELVKEAKAAAVVGDAGKKKELPVPKVVEPEPVFVVEEVVKKEQEKDERRDTTAVIMPDSNQQQQQQDESGSVVREPHLNINMSMTNNGEDGGSGIHLITQPDTPLLHQHFGSSAPLHHHQQVVNAAAQQHQQLAMWHAASLINIGNQQQQSRSSGGEGVNASYGQYVGKVLDGLSAKNSALLRKGINDLIAQYEQLDNSVEP